MRVLGKKVSLSFPSASSSSSPKLNTDSAHRMVSTSKHLHFLVGIALLIRPCYLDSGRTLLLTLPSSSPRLAGRRERVRAQTHARRHSSRMHRPCHPFQTMNTEHATDPIQLRLNQTRPTTRKIRRDQLRGEDSTVRCRCLLTLAQLELQQSHSIMTLCPTQRIRIACVTQNTVTT